MKKSFWEVCRNGKLRSIKLELVCFQEISIVPILVFSSITLVSVYCLALTRVYLDDEIVISIERCYCRCNYYWLWIVIKHFDWLWMDKKKYRKVEKRVPAKNELILNSSSFLLTEILVNFQKVLFFGETFSLNKQRVSQQAW